MEVAYKTLTLGTNPGFRGEAFYDKMHEDAVRVHQLFQQAAEAGIQMEQRSVSHQELKGLLLGGKHVVIALVDKDLHNLAVPLWFSPGAQTQEIGFKGHYIVLCGYSSDTEDYVVRDPDPRTAYLGPLSIGADLLDRARKAFGTDEDLLIVTMPPAAPAENA